MTPIEKIQLSLICKKDLDTMRPCKRGFDCGDCGKTVYDFRGKSQEDLIKTLSNQDSICGIFSKNQMQSKSHFLRPLILGSAITLSLSTYGNQVQAQEQDRAPQEIEKEEIVIVEPDDEHMVFGMIFETFPVFINGGEAGMIEFLQKNIKHPGDSTRGVVYIQFTIDTSGNTTNAKVIRGLSPTADSEAIRVVQLLKFTPGMQRGIPVAVNYTLPIRFGLKND